MQRPLLAALLGGLLVLPARAGEIPLLGDIVVTASRIPQSRGEVLADVRVLDRAALASAGQATLTELLQSQPGMEIASNGGPGQPTSLMLGGYSGGHTLVLLDGFRIGSATLGSTPLEQLIPAGFERVEVLRGAGSHLYGSDAMGGVLQLFSPQVGGKPGVHAAAGWGGFDTRRFDAGFRAGDKGRSFSLDAGRLLSDGYDATNSAVPFGAHNPDRDGFRNDHALMRAGLVVTDDHRVDLVGYRTHGRSQYDDSAGPNDTRSDTVEQLLGLTLRSHLSDAWDSQVRVGHGTDDSRFFTSFGDTDYHSAQRQYAWQNDLRLGDSRLQASLERLEQSVAGSVAYTTRERDNTALALSGQTRLGDHGLELAWRHDRNSQFGDRDTGALGYAWLGLPGWRLSARVATAFKAPAFNDLYYPNDGFSQGNPNLKPEQAVSREIALDGSPGGGTLRLACHDDRVSDLILWQFDLGLMLFTPANVNDARLTGCGVSYTRQVAGWNSRMGFDWQRARDGATGNDLPWRAPRRLTLALDRSLGDWRLGGELTAVSARFNDAANTQRLPGYALLALSLAYEPAPGWRIEGRLANALDQDYELTRGYNTPERNLFVSLRYQPR